MDAIMLYDHIVRNTYQHVLSVNTDETEEDSQRWGKEESGVFEGIAQGEYARAHVTLEVVHQGLEVPKILI